MFKFPSRKGKDLRFFLNLAQHMPETQKFSWIIISDVLQGLASNPNLSQKQFADLLSTERGQQKYAELVRYFAASHTKKADLKWMWDLVVKKNPGSVSLSSVGRTILKSLPKTDALRTKVIDYFERMKVGENYFFLIDAITDAANMAEYDHYVELLSKCWEAEGKQDYDFFGDLSNNKNLDGKRIKQIYDKLNAKCASGYAPPRVIRNLLSCPNVPKDLFDKMLKYKFKDKSLTSNIYAGAAANPVYAQKMLKDIHAYLKGGVSDNNSKHDVFISLFSNQTLSTEELVPFLELLEKQELNSNNRQIYFRLGSICSTGFERKNTTKDFVKRLCTLYLDYMDGFGAQCQKFGSNNMSGDPLNVFSKADLDEDIFDLIFERVSKNVLRNTILADLLANDNLTQEQYNKIIKVIEQDYFKGDKLIDITVHPQSDINTPHFILLNWISCKYVA